jgi:lipoprotein-anchoring transpeptidase ErfK/SrfK
VRSGIRVLIAAAPLAAVLALSACQATPGQVDAAGGRQIAVAKSHSQVDFAAPRRKTTPERQPAARSAQPQHRQDSQRVRPQRVQRSIRPTAQSRPVNHCRMNDDAQKALVSLADQHMWMCRHHRTVYDAAITSGMAGPYTHTPTGKYWIQGRNRNTTLTLNTGATYSVRYWIPFDAPLFGFHDSSWQHFPYGSPKYRTNGSHGCIHMPLRAIAWFYRWVARPTAVRIF